MPFKGYSERNWVVGGWVGERRLIVRDE